MREDRQSINEPVPYPAFYPQDEISLSEIFAVLRRRYLLIVLVIMFAMIAAAVYVINQQSVYESRAVLRVGLIGGMHNVSVDKSIEPSAILIKQMKEDYGIDDAQERPKLPRLESVSVDKSSDELIGLVTQAHSPDEAQIFLKEVSEKLLAKHQKRYDHAKQVLGGQLVYLRDVKATVDRALADIDRQAELLAQHDTSAAALFTLEKSRLAEQSLEAGGKISEVEIAQDLKSYPSSLLRAATYSETVVSPKRTLTLVLTCIMAFIVAIILAFIVEFISVNSRNGGSAGSAAKS
ncbi:hypothetical protein JYU18_00815 [bacterium AH-315-E07]|nr:hypothetical protein [bacterium AH-315-E07]